jgi:hypothetical protein
MSTIERGEHLQQTLHVWTADSEEWVVAYSADDACTIYCVDTIGCERATGDADAADHGTHVEHWTQLADDKVLPFAEECQEHHKAGLECPKKCDEGVIRTRKTCAEHARENGRGYLGSANY